MVGEEVASVRGGLVDSDSCDRSRREEGSGDGSINGGTHTR